MGEEKRKIYRGLNLQRLEANIAKDKLDNNWEVISESILSNNPEWVLEVIYIENVS